MNWEAIGALGEVFGALGVVITLVYFGVQLKRFSQQMKVQNVRGQAMELLQLASFQASPHMLNVLEKVYSENRSDLAYQEKVQIESYLMAQLASTTADYELFIEGIVENHVWEQRLHNAAMVMSPDWVRSYWNTMKGASTPGLVTAIDEALRHNQTDEYDRIMGVGLEGNDRKHVD
jgi:hypothetical protein